MNGGNTVECDWNGCDRQSTRELRYGHVETQKLALVARYCDEHADDVQAMFFVESDVELAAAVAA